MAVSSSSLILQIRASEEEGTLHLHIPTFLHMSRSASLFLLPEELDDLLLLVDVNGNWISNYFNRLNKYAKPHRTLHRNCQWTNPSVLRISLFLFLPVWREERVISRVGIYNCVIYLSINKQRYVYMIAVLDDACSFRFCQTEEGGEINFEQCSLDDLHYDWKRIDEG